MKGSERRQYQRVKTYYQLKYGTLTGTGWTPPILTTAKNLSANGVLFRTQEPLPIGALVRIEMHLLPMNQVLTLLAKVARVQPTRRGFDVAGQFVEITPDAQAMIDHYAQVVRQEPQPDRGSARSFQVLWHQLIGQA